MKFTQNILHYHKDKLEFIESDYSYIKKYNSPVYTSVLPNKRRQEFYKEFLSTGNVLEAIKNNLKIDLTSEQRKKYMYPILRKYLSNQVNGYKITDFFAKYNYKKIVLYAYTDLSKLFIEDMITAGFDMNNVYVIDKNAARIRNKHGVPVFDWEHFLKICNTEKIDIIVIGSIFYEHQIINDMLQAGIKLDLVTTATAIIFSRE